MSSFDPVLLRCSRTGSSRSCARWTNTLFRSRPLRRPQHGPRLLVLDRHRRQQLLASAEGLPSPRDRDGVPRRGDAEPARRHRARATPSCTTTRTSATRTAPTTRCSCRSSSTASHIFTVSAKAHQADCGNAAPTTYMPFARDIYEEGALNFPCVRVQRDYGTSTTSSACAGGASACRTSGTATTSPRSARPESARGALKELCAKYGIEQSCAFIAEWFDYSERRMAHVISQDAGAGDRRPRPPRPVRPGARRAYRSRSRSTVDPGRGDRGRPRDNIDCVPAGVNESRTCAINNVMTGIFNSIDPDIPHNAGTFRRVRVQLRENCVVGIRDSRTPARWRRPTSASGSSSRPSEAFADAGPATASPRAPAAWAPASPSSRVPTPRRAASRT